MKLTLPKLPYNTDALNPFISERQLERHYFGHLKGYIDKLNQLPIVSSSSRMKLEELVLMGRRQREESRMDTLPPEPRSSTLYNLSAQVYNHTFYFRCLKPNGGSQATGDIADIIKNQYGSFDSFRNKVVAKGNSLFGSGWVWVVLDDEGALDIIQSFDAETPIVYRGLIPLMCIDVWEHAYYLDYENHRLDYLRSVMGSLINWDFVNENLSHAG